MKKIFYISLLITFVTVFSCRKEREIVTIEFREHGIGVQKGSQGFNGLYAEVLNMESFETRMKKVNNDCEMFAQCGPVQVGVRKQGNPGFFFDYPIGINILIIKGTTEIFSWNTFKYRKVDSVRWRVSINGDDIIEFDMNIIPSAGYIGFGMADKGVVKTITWEPAFIFNDKPATECSTFGGARGGVFARPINHAEGGDQVTTTAAKYSL